MELLYKREHLGCVNYEDHKRPMVELVSIDKDEPWENLPLENKLVFLLNGEIKFSYGKFSDCSINKKQIFYLPSDYLFKCKALEQSTLLLMCMRESTQFCDNFDFEDLARFPCKEEPGNPGAGSDTTKDIVINDIEGFTSQESMPNTLEINDVMEQYLNFLEQCITVGLKCKFFYSIKVKELFYIFRCFYPKEKLNRFFNQILNGSSEFASFIIQNAYKYKSVTELAQDLNYTVSGFEKRFKRIFGASPYKWMTQQKAEKIFHEIRATEQTFKQISYNFDFTSLSHFNDFCKSKFGRTPGEIRQNKRNGGNVE
ncbi:MAG: AraC family transcriptional regulator [Prevotella sp.]|jgi:AraC-like DNA-binding protein|nr:AraC family transcriptional regulator [Prevotella sp.]